MATCTECKHTITSNPMLDGTMCEPCGLEWWASNCEACGKIREESCEC